MAWIETIPYDQADDNLKKVYDRVKSSNGEVDNILIGHSLRPHTLTGHMHLYKNVLHHSQNKLSKWYMEAIGVFVSILNGCHYCIEHHSEGLRKLINDEHTFTQVFEALQSGHFTSSFDPKQIAGLRYARQLTTGPQALNEESMEKLRKVGFDDGEILELNQVTSYFNYANRMVLGLGINTDGDILGNAPAGGDEDWQHK